MCGARADVLLRVHELQGGRWRLAAVLRSFRTLKLPSLPRLLLLLATCRSKITVFPIVKSSLPSHRPTDPSTGRCVRLVQWVYRNLLLLLASSLSALLWLALARWRRAVALLVLLAGTAAVQVDEYNCTLLLGQALP